MDCSIWHSTRPVETLGHLAELTVIAGRDEVRLVPLRPLSVSQLRDKTAIGQPVRLGASLKFERELKLVKVC